MDQPFSFRTWLGFIARFRTLGFIARFRTWLLALSLDDDRAPVSSFQLFVVLLLLLLLLL